MKVIDISNCSDGVIVYINNLQKYIDEKEKEIERLNNIINELEKWVKEDTKKSMMTMETGRAFNMFDILDKIKELKGDKKNDD